MHTGCLLVWVITRVHVQKWPLTSRKGVQEKNPRLYKKTLVFLLINFWNHSIEGFSFCIRGLPCGTLRPATVFSNFVGFQKHQLQRYLLWFQNSTTHKCPSMVSLVPKPLSLGVLKGVWVLDYSMVRALVPQARDCGGGGNKCPSVALVPSIVCLSPSRADRLSGWAELPHQGRVHGTAGRWSLFPQTCHGGRHWKVYHWVVDHQVRGCDFKWGGVVLNERVWLQIRSMALGGVGLGWGI